MAPSAIMNARILSSSTLYRVLTLILLLILSSTPEASQIHALADQASPPYSPATSPSPASPSPTTSRPNIVIAEEPTQPSMTTACAGDHSICHDPENQDRAARRNFEERIGGIIKELLAVEIEHFVTNVSGRALTTLTDELLSFSMRGELYLCLNVVSACPCLTLSCLSFHERVAF